MSCEGTRPAAPRAEVALLQELAGVDSVCDAARWHPSTFTSTRNASGYQPKSGVCLRRRCCKWKHVRKAHRHHAGLPCIGGRAITNSCWSNCQSHAWQRRSIGATATPFAVAAMFRCAIGGVAYINCGIVLNEFGSRPGHRLMRRHGMSRRPFMSFVRGCADRSRAMRAAWAAVCRADVQSRCHPRPHGKQGGEQRAQHSGGPRPAHN
jgi:hypothetical protein